VVDEGRAAWAMLAQIGFLMRGLTRRQLPEPILFSRV
jgi:hypothetical protein